MMQIMKYILACWMSTNQSPNIIRANAHLLSGAYIDAKHKIFLPLRMYDTVNLAPWEERAPSVDKQMKIAIYSNLI